MEGMDGKERVEFVRNKVAPQAVFFTSLHFWFVKNDGIGINKIEKGLRNAIFPNFRI
jgi:hypothetical protein